MRNIEASIQKLNADFNFDDIDTTTLDVLLLVNAQQCFASYDGAKLTNLIVLSKKGSCMDFEKELMHSPEVLYLMALMPTKLSGVSSFLKVPGRRAG